MSQPWVRKFVPFFGMFILLFCVHLTDVHADDTASATTDVEQSIQEKKKSITDLNNQIQTYQRKIEQKQQEKTTLANELDILQNRAEQTQLQLNETQAQIELIQSEITNIQNQIRDIQTKLDHQKELISEVIQKIQSQDHVLPIELFYGTDRFSSLLDTVQKLEQINTDLTQTVQETKQTREQLKIAQQQQIAKQEELNHSKNQLEDTLLTLAEQTDAKETLLTTTKNSEKQFQKLLQELKQEQSFVQNQIQELQTTLENRIAPSDRVGGGLLLWPLPDQYHRVSATFHDPSYPFRNLFEHPGTDIPAPVGTSVRAAASGYVAWTRRGTQYGNYVMVIHSDGLATLYAHLSRIDVVADQFIPRGGQIGLVGMTGLTTGSHLHFEVRKEGIPVDALPYLQSQ